jgi:hypothetical protein
VQEAPGELESVRQLLNTWVVPNDTRVPRDDFVGPLQLRRVRDDIRRAVESLDPAVLNPWLSRLHMCPEIHDGGIGWRSRGAGGTELGIVLTAIADGTWTRLKACPDCRWVFYDNTRNASKRWCMMNAGDSGGRSCGSIAKVKAHRQRHSGPKGDTPH